MAVQAFHVPDYLSQLVDLFDYADYLGVVVVGLGSEAYSSLSEGSG